MSKFQKTTNLLLYLCIAALLCVSFVNLISANNSIKYSQAATTPSEDVAEPYGLVTKMTLSIDAGNGYVTAIVKNNFTLFPSTIWVFVELYSSEDYQESYTTMQLMGRENIRDLDMGKSITVSAPTNGQTLYWQARMRYKFDNNDWVVKTTSTLLFDGEGNEIIF